MSPVVELVRRKAEPAYAVTCVATPPHLIDVWPFVRNGLAQIKRRQERDHPGRSTWTPEHVLHAIRTALLSGITPQHPWPVTQLWMAWDADAPRAFAVTQTATDPWLNVTNGLFVWMAYAEPSARGAVAVLDAELERIARERGYTHMTALTARRGLARRMAKLGWYAPMTCLQKDL